MNYTWGNGFTKFHSSNRKEAAKLAFDLAEKKYTVTVTFDGVWFIVDHRLPVNNEGNK